MAKLYLKFEQAVLKEVALSGGAVTVGRLPDNTVQIDNLAVSGHHCRIFWDTDHFVVEDNNSLNGTYVNNQRVNKATLKDNDEILVGKHVLHFQQAANEAAPAAPAAPEKPKMAGMEATVVFTTKNLKAALEAAAAGGHAPGAGASAAPATPAAPPRERIGVLQVLDGKTDEKQYILTSKLTVIGKSEMASVKLKGWFAPKVAANVMKRDNKYVIAAADKGVKIVINGEQIAGQHELADGDMLNVAGIKFQFNFQE